MKDTNPFTITAPQGYEEYRKNKKKGFIMKLIIGGFAQNKLSYVLSRLEQNMEMNLPPEQTILDAYLLLDETSTGIFAADSSDALQSDGFSELLSGKDAVVVNHLHLIIQKTGSREHAEAWLRLLEEACAKEQTELIVICDELGCGVIPAEKKDRIWREDVGRILCSLAARAESVERIICGIPVRIR